MGDGICHTGRDSEPADHGRPAASSGLAFVLRNEIVPLILRYLKRAAACASAT